jgi:Phage integrase, N-terminal SAM-like domain
VPSIVTASRRRSSPKPPGPDQGPLVGELANRTSEETELVVLSAIWFEETQGRDLSPSTVQAYRDRLDNQILPALAS